MAGFGVAPFLRPDGDLSPEEQRIAIAALAGSMRAPFGRTRSLSFTTNNAGVELTANRSDSILYIELRAIEGQVPVTFVVGPSFEKLSVSSSPEYIFPADSPARFLVYPGESLYARATSGGATLVSRNEVRV